MTKLSQSDGAVHSDPLGSALGSGPADYRGACIANLAASVASRFGVLPSIAPINNSLNRSNMLSERLNEARTVFLVILDGVGTRQLAEHCPDGALAAHQQGVLTSVFPSSTAPAITSLLTANTPAGHANPAWYAHLPEIDRIVRTLPMNVRGYPQESVPVDLWSWQGWTSVTNPACQRTAFQPTAIFDSAYSRQALAGCKRHAYDDPAELVQIVGTLAKEKSTADKFVYLYLPQFDSTAHDFGWQSDPALQCLQQFDQWFERCLSELTGTNALMIVLADHGFIDIPPECQHQLNDYPELQACLSAPLAGEPRTVFCRVEPSRESAFLSAIKASALNEICHCVRSADLIASGWFGPSANAELLVRCGTHTLLMHEGFTLTDHVPNERPMHFIGMHGGAAIDEMMVPLILAGVN